MADAARLGQKLGRCSSIGGVNVELAKLGPLLSNGHLELFHLSQVGFELIQKAGFLFRDSRDLLSEMETLFVRVFRRVPFHPSLCELPAAQLKSILGVLYAGSGSRWISDDREEVLFLYLQTLDICEDDCSGTGAAP